MKIVELKKKIPKILILPLIILFTFSVYSGVDKLEEKSELNKAHEYINFSKVSSALIHELQKERGYSSGFVASKGKSFFSELKQQRKITDKEILLLKVFLSGFDSTIYALPFKKTTKSLLKSLNKIDMHRSNVDKLSSSEVMEYYTDNINILLSLVEYIVTICNDSKLVVLTESYITLMKTKEKAGIERALVNKVLGEGRLSNDEFYKFGTLVAAQDVYIEYFKNIASQEHIDFLARESVTECFKEVEKERKKVYIKNKKNEILSSIKDYVGYGGLIHNFKNYVIRGEKVYSKNVQKQYDKLLIAIDRYKAFDDITSQERVKLNIIKNVFLEYVQAIPKVTKSYQKGTVASALDNIVKVNDTPAIEAIHDLTTKIYSSQKDWFKHATYRINILKKVEDKISNDLNLFIDNRNMYLTIQLMAEIIILLAIIVVIVLSVTMLRELIETGKMLNRAQENTRSGSYEYFFEDDVIFWSDEHYKLLQVDKNKFKPTMESFIQFIYPVDVDIVKENMKLAVSSKEIVFVEYRIILSDNTKMYVRSSFEIIKYDKKGNPLVMVGTITDISQSKKLEQEIVDTQKDVIFTMGAIGETRSKETGKHVKRVAEYSKLLYLLSGVDKDDAELLKMASPMHDIGKIGIPDDILNKPGKLNPGEWAIMQTHAEMGYDMLKNSKREILKLASIVALTHHERYDGSGYPKGLLANEIPLVGRITALADVFDALGSDRCYKTAWELEKILEHIKAERAKQFDPQLVDLFLENLDDFLKIREKYKE
jgi:response regulator RpfG family c-di-GMP phosphodiesterase